MQREINHTIKRILQFPELVIKPSCISDEGSYTVKSVAKKPLNLYHQKVLDKSNYKFDIGEQLQVYSRTNLDFTGINRFSFLFRKKTNESIPANFDLYKINDNLNREWSLKFELISNWLEKITNWLLPENDFDNQNEPTYEVKNNDVFESSISSGIDGDIGQHYSENEHSLFQSSPDEKEKINEGSSINDKLQIERFDVCRVVKAVIDSLDKKKKLENSNIVLGQKISSELWLHSDKICIQRIMKNLITEASNVVGSDGKVQVSIIGDNATQFDVEIRMNPYGLNQFNVEDNIDSTFKSRVIEARSGVNICVAYDLIELLEGKLDIRENQDNTISYRFSLPVRQVLSHNVSSIELICPPSVDIDSHLASSIPEGYKSKKVKTVLIIEDNEEMLDHLKSIIGEHYNSIGANNGYEAIKFLKTSSQQVDLIVSDMMMPGLDGFEFTSKIKKDPQLCKIPVIIVTGRADRDFKIQTLELGVDDYIVKPFYDIELILRCKNLMNRSEIRSGFEKDEIQGGASEDSEFDLDEQLMGKVDAVIEKELANSKFSVRELADQLGVGKTTLFRRIKRAIGISANQYIREFRLIRARKHLLSGDFHSVAEVSFAVGFDSPSYFTKKYFERFGIKPSSYLYGPGAESIEPENQS